MDMTMQAAIESADRRTVLHPFTHLKQHAEGVGATPRVIESGRGVRIRDHTGREFIDGFAGLYCVNVGYGRSEVAEAIAEQAHRLAYYHVYASHSNLPLIRLSERLVGMAPGGMSKVFYGLSGSDANETNVKIVWYYHNLLGNPKRRKIISRERGYHGCTVMAGSLTGLSYYHDLMGIPVPGVLHTGAPFYYWGRGSAENEEQFSARRAEELEALILREGPDTIAAFIAEPMLGTGGIVPPPAGYWPRIQSVLSKYDILMIADEVISGLGRLGAPFGCDLYGIKPDILTLAKALTSGYVPMSASLVNERIFRVLEEGSERLGSFSHGYTYSGHPLGAAAANACLDIYEREHLTENAERAGAQLLEHLRAGLSENPFIAEVRGQGLLVAIEFVADPERRVRFSSEAKVGPRIAAACLARGLICRAMPHGDILGFAPPLVVTPEEIDEIAGRALEAIAEVSAGLSRTR